MLPDTRESPGLSGANGVFLDLSVSIDATAIPQRMGGVGRYLSGLLGGLGDPEGVRVTLFTVHGDSARWERINPALEIRERSPDSRPLRLVWEQAALPRELVSAGADVHHGVHYSLPRFSRVAKAVTIHDLTFISHPEWHRRFKVPIFQRFLRTAVRQADALICVSQFTADRLAEWARPVGDVVVAAHGVDLARFSPDAPPGADEAVLERLGIRPPYVTFLGTIEPRKNVPALVAAFDALRDRHPDLRLVLAGAPGWAEAEVATAIRSSHHPERVLRLGHVRDDEVPAVLRHATAVAYPSLEEGFGLPVLEALACAAPTITTRGSAMEEAARGGALLVAPGSVEELTQAIDEVVTAGPSDERRRLGLAAAGTATWEASAAAHLQAYRLALARRDNVTR